MRYDDSLRQSIVTAAEKHIENSKLPSPTPAPVESSPKPTEVPNAGEVENGDANGGAEGAEGEEASDETGNGETAVGTEDEGDNPSEAEDEGSDGKEGDNNDTGRDETDNDTMPLKKLSEIKAELDMLNLPIGWSFEKKFQVTERSLEKLKKLKPKKVEESDRHFYDGVLELLGLADEDKDRQFYDEILNSLRKLKNQKFVGEEKFLDELGEKVKDDKRFDQYKSLILGNTEFKDTNDPDRFPEDLLSLYKILGLLLTAIAVSLGAPFWFDVLNKLVNVRSAGKKPETESEEIEDKKVKIVKIQ